MAGPDMARPADRRPRIFADRKPVASAHFQLDSQGLSPEEEALLLPVPTPRVSPPQMALADVIGTAANEAIVNTGKIAFHAVGDTGAVCRSTLPDEEAVTAAMTADLTADLSPSFLFHLGDVAYYFGEKREYYAQFYDPFRAYDRPIFAIPGNHDGVVLDKTHEESSTEASLAGFLANFCAASPGPSPDSGGLARDTMDQPGVYFTLDAPFVSIIGLYTNVLEGPGIISGPKVGNAQIEFLTGELARLKDERDAGRRAVIVACHHPPASIDETHGGGKSLTEDLETAYKNAGLQPDAVLSGHAHLYERWHRVIEGHDIPYLIAGSGGYGLRSAHASMPAIPFSLEGFEMKTKPIVAYGYLLITVDMTQEPAQLTIQFKPTKASVQGETVTVPIEKAPA
jgi:3',5'-cyclic AMP phosphodiesterase CpdA